MSSSNPETIEEFQAELERLMSRKGSHTHNIIGILLRQVDKKLGRESANKMIDDYFLDCLYGFNREPYEQV
jgi:hypothetical protein